MAKVIYSPAEAQVNDYKEEECYGFWSNQLGWTTLDLATVFPDDATVHFLGTIWVNLPLIPWTISNRIGSKVHNG